MAQLITGDVFQDLPVLRRFNCSGQSTVDVVLGDFVSLKGQQSLSDIVADSHCFAAARLSSFVKKSRKIGSRLTKLTQRMKCLEGSKLKVELSVTMGLCTRSEGSHLSLLKQNVSHVSFLS